MIDTPGFNNLRTPDIEILDYIAWILGEFARAGRYLTGIIFLQAIDQRKIAPAEFKLVQLIKNICGSHAYENIIIVTTLWSDCPDGKRALIQVRDREELLWSDMIDGGTEVWQHHNSPHSAWAIVEQLARQTVVVLDLQYELDVNDGRLLSTTAGREAHQVAYGMYCVEQKSLYATIRQLKHELRMANHYNDYLQRRCADLEIERSAKKFEEQEVRRKKVSPACNIVLTVTAVSQHKLMSLARFTGLTKRPHGSNTLCLLADKQLPPRLAGACVHVNEDPISSRLHTSSHSLCSSVSLSGRLASSRLENLSWVTSELNG